MSNHSSEEEMDPYEEQDTPLLVEFSRTEEGTLQPVGLRDWFDRDKLKEKSDKAIEKAMTFIQDMSKKVNSTVKEMEGNIMDQLFIWENIPNEEYDVQSLRDFLETKFRWNWISQAIIRREKNIIEISSGQHLTILRMNSNQTKAKLIERGKPLYEFAIQKLTDTIAAYTDEFTIEGLKSFKIKGIEIYLLQFTKDHQEKKRLATSYLTYIQGTYQFALSRALKVPIFASPLGYGTDWDLPSKNSSYTGMWPPRNNDRWWRVSPVFKTPDHGDKFYKETLGSPKIGEVGYVAYTETMSVKL